MANCGTRDGTARPLRRVPHAGRRVASEALCRPCFRWYAPAAPADASHNALAPGASSRMANIYDVARAARVSVATVSAVVNDSAYVSPPLKARVQNAIRKLGYQPNLLARSLAKRPKVLLLDEPAANLDPRTSDLLYDVLDAYTQDPAKTVIIATHDLELGELKEQYPGEIRNNCVEVTQQDGELLFDYKLHPGVTQSHNATYLLRKMGLMEDDE